MKYCKWFLLLIFLTGCSFQSEKTDVTEIPLEKVNKELRDYISRVEMNELMEETDSNGIFLKRKNEQTMYLYLSSNYFQTNNEISEIELKDEENALKILLREDSKIKEVSNGKLYKIYSNIAREYLRIFKSGEETYFQNIEL